MNELNWNAIGAIGEIVGAAAVVITLAYLAVQIRQNTKVARSQARQAIAEMTMSSAVDLVRDRGLLSSFLDELSGAEVDPVDRARIVGRNYVVMRNWENIHYQYLVGMLTEDEWRGFRLNLAAILEWSSMQTFWDNEHQYYSEAFQTEVASIRAELANPDPGLRHGYITQLGDQGVVDIEEATP